MKVVRYMVDSFVSRHYNAWEKVRDQYEKEHNGITLGRPLSLQSFIGSDLTIDLYSLANDIEEKDSFKNEYWIRSQGMQCIRNEEDREVNKRVWSDVVGKFEVEKNGDRIDFRWLQDEDCKVQNTLLRDGILYDIY